MMRVTVPNTGLVGKNTIGRLRNADKHFNTCDFKSQTVLHASDWPFFLTHRVKESRRDSKISTRPAFLCGAVRARTDRFHSYSSSLQGMQERKNDERTNEQTQKGDN